MADTSSTLSVRAPTIKEEFETLKWLLNRLLFYKERGYVISLPDISSLCDPKMLEDPDKMFTVFKTSEYNADFFAEAIKLLSSQQKTLETLLKKLLPLVDYWDFKIFPEYKIVLTKYGPGGRYNPNTGTVELLSFKGGRFGREPTHTIIHEIVHIGIEDSIVDKFNLNHSEKERLVDLLVKIIFKDEFPKYLVQKIGDDRLDKYVTDETINSLSEAISRYIKDFPR